jgi:pimeloyl-ACP methyl ester carboxylesterase
MMKLMQKLGIAYVRTKIKLTAIISKRSAAKQAFTLFCTPFANFKRKAEPKYAESVQFTCNGLLIKGHRWNHPQTKKALLLHGFSSAAYKFDSYVTMLVQKGYEVLSFDAPAHGDSEGKTTNAVEYSQMITKAVELYGPVNSYIAHSFGGLALSLAIENLPQDETTKIVFIAPATETATAIDEAFKMLGIKDKVVRQEFDHLVYEISGHEPEWFSIRRALKNSTAKILWLHDEEDDTTPLSDALKVKADNHPNINFVITKGLGHRKIYHDKTVKKTIENFL